MYVVIYDFIMYKVLVIYFYIRKVKVLLYMIWIVEDWRLWLRCKSFIFDCVNKVFYYLVLNNFLFIIFYLFDEKSRYLRIMDNGKEKNFLVWSVKMYFFIWWF